MDSRGKYRIPAQANLLGIAFGASVLSQKSYTMKQIEHGKLATEATTTSQVIPTSPSSEAHTAPVEFKLRSGAATRTIYSFLALELMKVY